MSNGKLDLIVKQAIAKFPEAKNSITQMADKVIKSSNEKAIELYTEELQRQISSQHTKAKHFKRGNEQFEQWSNALSEGFGLKFWAYILPRLMILIVVVTAVIYMLFFFKR
jgi:uncharacterized protein YhjY with autotransporter beta-barrel domain